MCTFWHIKEVNKPGSWQTIELRLYKVGNQISIFDKYITYQDRKETQALKVLMQKFVIVIHANQLVHD